MRLLWVAFFSLGLLTGPLASQPLRIGRGRGRLFSLPRTQDDLYRWNRARQDISAGRMAEAVERLQLLLREGHQGVVPLDRTGERFFGLQMAVITTLRELPPAGQKAYDKLTEREAGTLLRTALDTGRREELLALARDFPTSTAGRRARIRLGDLALEAGDGIGAVGHYLAAQDSLPQRSPLRAALEERMVAARVIAGAAISSIPIRLRHVAKEILEALPGASAEHPLGGYAAYGGGAENGRLMRAPLGQPGLHWQKELRAPGFEGSPFPMHAIGGLDGIFVTDGLSLFAFDALDGELLWQADGPMRGGNGEDQIDDYRGAINPDMALAAAYDRKIVVAALQVPGHGENARFRAIDVIRKIPARRLFAFDRASGKLLWSHWRPGDPRLAGHDVAGPPIIHGDTVIVPSQDQTGAIAFYLAAYDLKTGMPRWRRLICSSQGEVNMFGNVRTEFTAAPLAINDGVVYGTTNLGVCFAAGAKDGNLRWVTAYEVIELPPTRLTGQRPREVFFANSPACVTDGVVAFTPLDSAYALGLDGESGKPLWRMEYRIRGGIDVRWLLGSLGDEFIFSGLGVVAQKAHPHSKLREPAARVVRTPESLGLGQNGIVSVHGIPRGALADGRIYFPTPHGLMVFDKNGNTDPSMMDLGATGGDLGNLLLVDGLLISSKNPILEAYYDEGRLLQEAERRALARSADVAAILRYASLLRARAEKNLAGSAGSKAEHWYLKGLAAATKAGMSHSSPIFRRLSSELFHLSLVRAEEVARRSPSRALVLLRQARERALDGSQWVGAELRVLSLLQGRRAEYLRELELMSERHGELVYSFPGAGRMPVAAFSLWRGIDYAPSPGNAVRRCQGLIERFGDVMILGKPARLLASAKQGELIARHGKSVYQKVEARARAQLREAARDAGRLRGLALRYPHSSAAREALLSILDLAVQRGDMASASRAFAQALSEGAVTPGLLRRMLEVARKAGNLPLARAFRERLLSGYPAWRSDWPDDHHAPMREVTPGLLGPATSEAPAVEPPLGILTTLTGSLGTAMRICAANTPRGFPARSNIPLYISLGEDLRAYDPSRGKAMFEHALFSIPYQFLSDTDRLAVVGKILVLPELNRVRGVDYLTGEERWSFVGDKDRMLVVLGIQEGVLHLFSEMRNAGDGGILIGLEPISGTVLFRHVFGAFRDSIAPVSSGGSLWVLHPGDDDTAPHILRIDPLTGATIAQTRLGPDLQNRLRLDLRRLRTITVHNTMFADEDAIYLPVDGLGDDEPPRVAAIDHSGKELWIWTGLRGRTLAMTTIFRDRMVILERGLRSSTLTTLDKKSGVMRSSRMLGSWASVRNWSPGWRHDPCPPTLLILHSNQSQARSIDCISLDGKRTSFRYQLRGSVEQVVERPYLGRDFLAIGVRKRDISGVSLIVLDPKTRRSLLPQGSRSMRLRLKAPFRLHALAPYLLLESGNRLTVFARNGRPPR